MSENPYDALMPAWMQLQFAIRDRDRLYHKEKLWQSDEYYIAVNQVEVMTARWREKCARALNTFFVQLEWEDDGSCVVAGVMRFNKY